MLTQRSKARLLHVWTHNTHIHRQKHCDQLSASDLSYPCIEIPPLWPLFPPRPTVDLLLHMHYGKAQRSQMTLWMLVRCFLATITGFGVPRLPRKTGGVRKIGLLGKSCHFPCFLSCRKTCQRTRSLVYDPIISRPLKPFWWHASSRISLLVMHLRLSGILL